MEFSEKKRTLTDLAPGDDYFLGFLYVDKDPDDPDRPRLRVRFRCTCCGRVHRHSWTTERPELNAVEYRYARCETGPLRDSGYFIGLNPKLARNNALLIARFADRWGVLDPKPEAVEERGETIARLEEERGDGRRIQLRVSVDDFTGRPQISLRLWAADYPGGPMFATRVGLGLWREQLVEVAAAILEGARLIEAQAVAATSTVPA
jgi:hypothetical protein